MCYLAFLVPFHCVLNKIHYLGVELCDGNSHALRWVQVRAEISSWKYISYLGNRLGNLRQKFFMVQYSLAMSPVSEFYFFTCRVLTTKRNFIAPHAKDTYSGWCWASVSMITE